MYITLKRLSATSNLEVLNQQIQKNYFFADSNKGYLVMKYSIVYLSVGYLIGEKND